MHLKHSLLFCRFQKLVVPFMTRHLNAYQATEGHNNMRRFTSTAFWFVFAVALTASAEAKDYPLQVKVLSAESHQILGPPERALEGCNWRAIDAYCYASTPVPYTVNTMTVQENGGAPFSVECTAYRWSHCTGLPVDQTFPARQSRRGITIAYPDKSGKQHTQLYERAASQQKE